MTGHQHAGPASERRSRHPKRQAGSLDRLSAAFPQTSLPFSLAEGGRLLYYSDCSVKRLWVPFTVRALWAFRNRFEPPLRRLEIARLAFWVYPMG